MKKSFIVITIAGVTCGGKSSVADRIMNDYPNVIRVNTDDFFREKNDPKHIWIELTNKIKHQNWETLESYDWIKFNLFLAKLYKDNNLDEKSNGMTNSIKIENGNCEKTNEKNDINCLKDDIKYDINCLKDDEKLNTLKKSIKIILFEGNVALCHQYPDFVKLDKKIFITLSEKICKERRSVRIYDPEDPPLYFEECVWPSYLKHLESSKSNYSDIIFVDGSLDKEKVFSKINEEIENTLLSLI